MSETSTPWGIFPRRRSAAAKKASAKKASASRETVAPTTLKVVEGGRRMGRIRESILALARQKKRSRLDSAPVPGASPNPFAPWVPPPGVLPKGETIMAMDDTTQGAQTLAWAQSGLSAYFSEGLVFPGYTYLAELTLRPEYRVVSQVIATECTRKWIKFTAAVEAQNEEGAEDPFETEGAEGEAEGEAQASGERDTLGDPEQSTETSGGEREEDRATAASGDPEAEGRSDRSAAEGEGETSAGTRAESELRREADEQAQDRAPEKQPPEKQPPDKQDKDQDQPEDRERLTHEDVEEEDPDADPEDRMVNLQVQRERQKLADKDQQELDRDDRLARMTSEDDKSDRIKELEKEFKRLCVQDTVYRLVEMDGWMGRSHLFFDIDKNWERMGNAAGQLAVDDREELKTDIGDGQNEVSKNKVGKGYLKRLAVVEPVWTYPVDYNSSDPLRDDWYNPQRWFVMGKEVHVSRLLCFIGQPVPDILKPAFAFGGLSRSQMAKPYVDNWLQTRQSVNDVIRAYSVMVLLTDLSSVGQMSDADGGMPGEGSSLFNRVDLFNLMRDNRGTFVLDKSAEDFKNVSVPLSGLSELQAQSQEHMGAVSRIPLVKLLGISPTGLNASSEGELKAFYDTIHAFQEARIRGVVTKIMHFAMLNLWGEVDEDIDFQFEELWELDPKEKAELRKTEAETDDIYINGCNAIHPEEVRKKLAGDPESPYGSLDVADIPDAPVEESHINLHGTAPFAKGPQGEEGGEEQGKGEGAELPNPFGG